MAGRAVGAHAEPVEDPQHGQTHGPDGRLGDIGSGERRLLLQTGAGVKDGVRENAVAQASRALRQRVRVRLGDRFPRLREDARQVPAHADVLTGLSRKEERESAWSLWPAEEHPRPGPRLLVPLVRQRRGRVGEEPGRVGTRGHHDEQAQRMIGRERAP